ncbi:exonuclease SbcCD subunit D [Brachybacterium muris]|uniref:Nuclease SbcCD subunit D n=1 Tax=Brachybacterium muris UCD-AY4 TaxID=1249481 RepID=A0A022L0J0_9MICO|nr:exonuclease SbcCD subunit D [Brachybacterium muris]EYT49394.1 exodeoxyribonuclease I [Brachybacterium muris UCD-AY4]
MRILHTSDWHLGRTLHGENLHAHQVAFHDWLLDQVVEREVDVVVIAGDVYDRAVPHVDSVRLLGRTLARLAEVTTVVLTPGNHDSADRLGFGAALMRAGAHILADIPGLDHPVVVPDDHGEVLFFGLPYLEPDMARTALVGEGEAPLARSHEAVTRAAMDRVRTRIDAHTEVSASGAAHAGSARPRSVVLAHTFVAGGQGSDSERDLTVGGVDSVPASVLGGVDYVALGHLHGCQDLSASVGGAAWYSGSPLAFSFSEKDHRKSVLLVELGAPGQASVERIPTPVPRRLTELRGTLEEILAQADQHGEDWLKAIITDPARPPHLLERLRARYPHLLHTEYQPSGRTTTALTPTVRRDADPVEVMDEFLAFVTGGEPTAAELQVLDDAYRAVRTRGQEAAS